MTRVNFRRMSAAVVAEPIFRAWGSTPKKRQALSTQLDESMLDKVDMDTLCNMHIWTKDKGPALEVKKCCGEPKAVITHKAVRGEPTGTGTELGGAACKHSMAYAQQLKTGTCLRSLTVSRNKTSMLWAHGCAHASAGRDVGDIQQCLRLALGISSLSGQVRG